MSKGKQIYSRHINQSESPIGQLLGSRPPSGKTHVNGLNIMNGTDYQKNINDNRPPMLRRGVTADEYSLHRLNMHQEYQNRRGHLKVNKGYEQPIR